MKMDMEGLFWIQEFLVPPLKLLETLYSSFIMALHFRKFLTIPKKEN